MRLFILRHGEAETHAPTDSQRALTAHGRAAVREVIQQNLTRLQSVTQLWVSPYVRAQQTADEVTGLLTSPTRWQCDHLTPDGTVATVVSLLAAATDQCPLLVSHQPLVGELVNGLTGKPAGYYAMGTAALACIDIDPVALGCGDLQWLK